ncbi:MAG: hypothetical protein EXS10_01905 [Phycisphaerales bacterium]|nr:hypothetical protein [Phycisphaerales bacterium]
MDQSAPSDLLSSSTVMLGLVALASAGLVLLMRPGARSLRLAGSVLGLAGVAGLFVEVLKLASGGGGIPPILPVLFGVTAIAGAARVMTHPRPVFAAVYFILVVVASAGLFLLLGADFMAFALIIVYAGAILVTYMFVLMLAQQSPVEGDATANWYDRVPREAVSCVIIGFVMVATLAQVLFNPNEEARRVASSVQGEAQTQAQLWETLAGMPKQLKVITRERLQLAKDAPVQFVAGERSALIQIEGDTRFVVATVDGKDHRVMLTNTDLPVNAQVVGATLVNDFPASIEVAGVILTMALFGAVVLARKQVELGEDERRELAGLSRLSVEPDSGASR